MKTPFHKGINDEKGNKFWEEGVGGGYNAHSYFVSFRADAMLTVSITLWRGRNHNHTQFFTQSKERPKMRSASHSLPLYTHSSGHMSMSL